MPLRANGRVIAACMACAAAAPASAAEAARAVWWECTAPAAETSAAIPPEALFGSALARYARFRAAPALGVFQAGGRAILLVAGAPVGGPPWSDPATAELDLAAGRHLFRSVPSVPDARLPDGWLCFARGAPHRTFTRTESGAIALAPGATAYLVEPSDPAVAVEMKALGSVPLPLREALALAGRLGIYAGLAPGRARADADTAVLGEAGRIVFKRVAGLPAPEVLPAARAAIVAERPAPVSRLQPPPPATPIAAPAPAEEPPRAVALAEPGARATPMQAAGEAAAAAPPRLQARDAAQRRDAVAAAVEALLARRGHAAVRSLSELTAVHPAVEALRERR